MNMEKLEIRKMYDKVVTHEGQVTLPIELAHKINEVIDEIEAINQWIAEKSDQLL